MINITIGNQCTNQSCPMCLFLPALSCVRLLCTVENNNTTVYTVPSDYSFRQNSRTTKMTSSYKQ